MINNQQSFSICKGSRLHSPLQVKNKALLTVFMTICVCILSTNCVCTVFFCSNKNLAIQFCYDNVARQMNWSDGELQEMQVFFTLSKLAIGNMLYMSLWCSHYADPSPLSPHVFMLVSLLFIIS